MDPIEAINTIRTLRPGSIETRSQEVFIVNYFLRRFHSGNRNDETIPESINTFFKQEEEERKDGSGEDGKAAAIAPVPKTLFAGIKLKHVEKSQNAQ